MKKIRKILSVFIVLTMSLSLCACAGTHKDIETGKINDVDINNDVISIPESDYQPFTELNDNLGYEYKEVKSDYLQLRFNVPSTWKVSNVHAGAIKLQAPDNDPYTPGCTCYLLSIKGMAGMEEILPFQFEDFFEYTMPGFYYNIQGSEYHEVYNDQVSEIYSNTDFTTDTQNFSFVEYKDVYLENKDGISTREQKVDAFHYDVDWSNANQTEMDLNLFLSLKSVVPEEYSDGTRKVLTHIVSSFKGHLPPKNETKDVVIDGITITLPQVFEEVSNNIYKVDTKIDSQFTGIQIGVFESDLNLESFDGLKYAQTNAVLYANAFMPGYNNVPSFPTEEPMQIAIDGKTVTFIYGTSTHFGNPNNNYSADFYGDVVSATMMVYELGDKQIVIWTPDSQFIQAVAISDLIIEKTRF